MKAVGLIGLGLIGGSMAKAIRQRTDCEIFGMDADEAVLSKAVSDGTVTANLKEHFDEIDMLLVALYPTDVVNVIEDAAPHLKKGCIIVDCTGVKEIICTQLSEKLSKMGLRFIGGHPMAGREVAGYANADAGLYDGASMILCVDEHTDADALSVADDFFRRLGFARVVHTTFKEHDRVIAYTSQLAHIVSSAYIKSETLQKRYGFSAGSFKDMTRVAKLNEEMWADLFLANEDAIVSEIDSLIAHLQEYEEALKGRDRDELVSLLRDGRMRKENDEAQEARSTADE